MLPAGRKRSSSHCPGLHRQQYTYVSTHTHTHTHTSTQRSAHMQLTRNYLYTPHMQTLLLTVSRLLIYSLGTPMDTQSHTYTFSHSDQPLNHLRQARQALPSSKHYFTRSHTIPHRNQSPNTPPTTQPHTYTHSPSQLHEVTPRHTVLREADPAVPRSALECSRQTPGSSLQSPGPPSWLSFLYSCPLCLDPYPEPPPSPSPLVLASSCHLPQQQALVSLLGLGQSCAHFPPTPGFPREWPWSPCAEIAC